MHLLRPVQTIVLPVLVNCWFAFPAVQVLICNLTPSAVDPPGTVRHLLPKICRVEPTDVQAWEVDPVLQVEVRTAAPFAFDAADKHLVLIFPGRIVLAVGVVVGVVVVVVVVVVGGPPVTTFQAWFGLPAWHCHICAGFPFVSCPSGKSRHLFFPVQVMVVPEVVNC